MEKITDQDTIEKFIRVFIKKPRKLNGHLSITDLTTILTHALLKRLTVDTSFLTPCNLQCNRIISNQINISALYRKDTQPCSACNSYHKNVLIKPLLSNTIQKKLEWSIHRSLNRHASRVKYSCKLFPSTDGYSVTALIRILGHHGPQHVKLKVSIDIKTLRDRCLAIVAEVFIKIHPNWKCRSVHEIEAYLFQVNFPRETLRDIICYIRNS